MAEFKKKGFNFTVNGEFWLEIEEVWPDGDAPENPTVDDVLAVIKHCGGKADVIEDWFRMEELDLTVSDDKDSKDAP